MYGAPVFDTPNKPVLNAYGDEIEQGGIEYWDNEVEGLKNDHDGVNDFYRQFPRTESHAIRDEAKHALITRTET